MIEKLKIANQVFEEIKCAIDNAKSKTGLDIGYPETFTIDDEIFIWEDFNPGSAED